VAGFGTARATAETLPALRQKVGPVDGEPLPGSFLKHADDQTVVGLMAVYRAIQQHQLSTTRFADWGVLAAPRFLGRVLMAASLKKFEAEGAWGISPHLIPHRSLHSVSGTVSQALHIHGPNFGVGGGPGAAAEVLLAATALIAGDQVPGVWVVLTGWDPEPVPEVNGHANPVPICGGVALALVGPRADWHGPRLRVVHRRQRPWSEFADRSPRNSFSLESLLATLEGSPLARTAVVWPLDTGGWMELQWGPASVLPAAEPRPSNGRVRSPSRNGAGAENQL
jgi:hypothetical protein